MQTEHGSKSCEHELVTTPEDNAVCVLCGLVVDGGIHDYSSPVEKGKARPKLETTLGAVQKLYGTYMAIFHFNERMAQLCLQEPAIPQELFELIETEFDFGDFERTYPDAKALTKADVSKICASIRVPEDLQEKYRSKKFKCNPLSNMKRFAEKWLTIRRKLGGDAPPPLHPNDIYQMQRDFVAILRPFNMFRHNAGCPGGPKCHKSPAKCRHNLPNYNYIILQLLRRRNKDQIYRSFLPQLRTGSKIKNLDVLCTKIWDFLGWEFRPVFERKKRQRKPKQASPKITLKTKIRKAPIRRSPRLIGKIKRYVY